MSEDVFSQKNHDIRPLFRHIAQKYFSSPVHLSLNFFHPLSHFSTLTRFCRFYQTSDVCPFSAARRRIMMPRRFMLSITHHFCRQQNRRAALARRDIHPVGGAHSASILCQYSLFRHFLILLTKHESVKLIAKYTRNVKPKSTNTSVTFTVPRLKRSTHVPL